MASYYKHRETHSRKIPYTFTCEHCLQGSGALSAVILGSEAEYNSMSKTLSETQALKLREQAHMHLKKQVRYDHSHATEKKIISQAFADTCPHCQKPQSWGLSGMKDDLWTMPIVLLVVGVIVTLGIYFAGGLEARSLSFALMAFGAFLLLAVGTLIVKWMKIAAKARRVTSTAMQKNLPEIDWSAAADLLAEE